jgi:hypothetical protein
MSDDDGDYLDSLIGGRLVMLCGNPPGDSDEEMSERSEIMVGRGERRFVTMPPDFVPRTRSPSNHSDSQGSCFRNHDHEDPRNLHWKNNHVVTYQTKNGGHCEDSSRQLHPSLNR